MRALQSRGSTPVVQLQIRRGLDEPQVRQRLRKVAEKSAGLRIHLLRIEADIIGALEQSSESRGASGSASKRPRQHQSMLPSREMSADP